MSDCNIYYYVHVLERCTNYPKILTTDKAKYVLNTRFTMLLRSFTLTVDDRSLDLINRVAHDWPPGEPGKTRLRGSRYRPPASTSGTVPPTAEMGLRGRGQQSHAVADRKEDSPAAGGYETHNADT